MRELPCTPLINVGSNKSEQDSQALATRKTTDMYSTNDQVNKARDFLAFPLIAFGVETVKLCVTRSPR